VWWHVWCARQVCECTEGVYRVRCGTQEEWQDERIVQVKSGLRVRMLRLETGGQAGEES